MVCILPWVNTAIQICCPGSLSDSCLKHVGAPCVGSLIHKQPFALLIHEPADNWMLSKQQPSVQPYTFRTGPASISEWVHVNQHDSPPGSLAEEQKCKSICWLCSVTCSQGNPNQRRSGRVVGKNTLPLLGAFFFNPSAFFFSHVIASMLGTFRQISPS